MKKLLLPLAISVALISYGWSQNVAVEKTEMTPSKPISSRYEKVSIEDILDKSDDPELIKLSGEIIKKIQCSTYLFRDETGEIRVQIDDNYIPDRGLLFNTPVIISGEIESASHGMPFRVDADKVRYFF
ncbi:hypothetical protein ACH42_12325 [Endozoicomonas sp. (ex Bugula neritina AB1)]|nr:hypothetical protein ACH42_12325 [Endozoicomonas sp. (ex Bugula neritina AB1)]